MLEWMLFAIGVFLCLMGATKTTGLRNLPEVDEYLAVFFFIYGMVNIFAALFLFNAPMPFGATLNQTTNSTYANFTGLEDSSCYNESGGFIGNGTTNKTEPQIISATTTYEYAVAPREIVNGLSTINMFVIALYIGLFMASIIKGAISKEGHRYK